MMEGSEIVPFCFTYFGKRGLPCAAVIAEKKSRIGKTPIIRRERRPIPEIC